MSDVNGECDLTLLGAELNLARTGLDMLFYALELHSVLMSLRTLIDSYLSRVDRCDCLLN